MFVNNAKNIRIYANMELEQIDTKKYFKLLSSEKDP